MKNKEHTKLEKKKKRKRKEASTFFTFGQIAALYGDICPRAIHSVPFWRWIRACAHTCPVTLSTCHAAWLP